MCRLAPNTIVFGAKLLKRKPAKAASEVAQAELVFDVPILSARPKRWVICYPKRLAVLDEKTAEQGEGTTRSCRESQRSRLPPKKTIDTSPRMC